MSSSFYGNRRFFETKLNVSTCPKSLSESEEVYRRTAIMWGARPQSSLRRSFSLQYKSKMNGNAVQNAHISKKQSTSCKLGPTQARDNDFGVMKSPNSLNQNSPVNSRNGSFCRKTSIDESSVYGVDFSIYVHGYCGVGKSTLINQLPHVFSANEIFDFGIEHREEIFINNNENSIHVKEIDVLYKGKFQNADIHLVVFALDDIASMKYAIDRVTFLRWKCRILSPIFMIGNKSDKMIRKPNFERDVEFITKKLNCHYLRLSGTASDITSILKIAMETVFTKDDDACCTTKKTPFLKRIFKCFFSWKKTNFPL